MKLQDISNTHLRGQWPTIARLIWVVLAFSAIVTFAASLPSLLDPQTSLCNPPETPCIRTLILPEEADLLPQIGLSLATYNLLTRLSDSLLFASMWLVMSALILWRKSDERIAVLTALFMIGFPFSLVTGAVHLHPVLLLLSSLVVLFNGILAILFFLFPTGEFVPRWTRWVAYAFLAWWAIRDVVFTLWAFAYGNTPPTGILANYARLANLVYFGVFLLSFLSQVYRYLHISTPVQRQQTKLIFLSILSLPVLDLLVRGVVMPGLFPEWFKPGIGHIVYNLVSNPFLSAGFFLVPLSFAVAVFRYRLYAIDVIIRRTLIYSSLTALLALIYFASVIFLQQVFRTLTGVGDDFAIIVSTLGIAALFNPLRHRVQRVIDRRFYRQKYDAQKIITQFGATVRDEVDLQNLTENLVAVVEQTMQPSSLSLWVKQTEDGRRRMDR